MTLKPSYYEQRTCSKCGLTQSLQQFHKDARYNGGYQRWCKSCFQDSHLRCSYGLTRLEFEALLTQQGGVCAICGCAEPAGGRRTRLSVDHDHQTGRVRGLLCTACNTGLGKFRDNTRLLARATDYLSKQNTPC